MKMNISVHCTIMKNGYEGKKTFPVLKFFPFPFQNLIDKMELKDETGKLIETCEK